MITQLPKFCLFVSPKQHCPILPGKITSSQGRWDTEKAGQVACMAGFGLVCLGVKCIYGECSQTRRQSVRCWDYQTVQMLVIWKEENIKAA